MTGVSLFMRSKSILVLAVLLAACGGAPPQAKPVLLQRADAAALAANRAAQVGNDEEAADLWRSALTLRQAIDDWSGAGEARLGLAQVLVRLHRSDDAVRAIDGMPTDALFPDQQRARAAYQLAVIDTGAGHLSDARLHLKLAVSLCGAMCPIPVPLQNLDARLLLLEGDAAGALSRASTSIDAGSVERAHAGRIRAESLGALGRSAEALAELRGVILLDRQLAEPAYLADDYALQLRLAESVGDAVLAAQAQARLDRICAAASVRACQEWR
ncbi:hypothetical protein [Jeongeupia naejangsanensis]|uniref:Tetratricopeptide repeat protein n=1 Tax=Jeongeupia naejangsanensis TaxID=613195 RepID=A0ABS2BFT6_9NEIS|nr:hypothetical protein [Jeongeupia naejangsanensis]MBM3114468.1 hypothetical protein [Jeongeupia naejangsanensis]